MDIIGLIATIVTATIGAVILVCSPRFLKTNKKNGGDDMSEQETEQKNSFFE